MKPLFAVLVLLGLNAPAQAFEPPPETIPVLAAGHNRLSLGAELGYDRTFAPNNILVGGGNLGVRLGFALHRLHGVMPYLRFNALFAPGFARGASSQTFDGQLYELAVGARKVWRRSSRFQPFVSVDLGWLGRSIQTEHASGTRASDAQSFFHTALGGGVEVPLGTQLVIGGGIRYGLAPLPAQEFGLHRGTFAITLDYRPLL